MKGLFAPVCLLLDPLVHTTLSLSLVRRELHSDCLALLQAPHIQEEAQLTLPLDINNYPFYRYVQIYFRVRCASVYLEYYSQPQDCRYALNNHLVCSLKLAFWQLRVVIP